MNSELVDLVGVASQLALGIPCLSLLSTGIVGEHHTLLAGLWELIRILVLTLVC